MPYVYAHAFCGERTLALLSAEVRELIAAHCEQYLLGLQGPDPWFYHNASPFMRAPSFASFGQRLHAENIDGTFAAMLDEVLRADGSRRFAYFAGYLCHYALDCTAHPYVLYRAGEDRYHTPFEAAIDLALLRRRGETLRTLPLSAQLPEVDPKPFAALHLAAARAMGVELPKEIAAEPPAHMRKLLPALSDPTGIVHPLVSALEVLLGKRGLLSDKLYWPGVEKGIDALNSAHLPWQAPWEERMRRESFDDLLETASKKAAQYGKCVYDALRGNAQKGEVLASLGALSFDTGLYWKLSPPLRYTDCAFTHKRSRAGVPHN